MINREDILPGINRALRMTTAPITHARRAATITETLHNDMMVEVGLIVRWKDAVTEVKNNAFNEDLEDGQEQDKELIEEIKDIFENDDDVRDIKKVFNDLKDAAQKYLNKSHY